MSNPLLFLSISAGIIHSDRVIGHDDDNDAHDGEHSYGPSSVLRLLVIRGIHTLNADNISEVSTIFHSHLTDEETEIRRLRNFSKIIPNGAQSQDLDICHLAPTIML